MMQIVEAFKTGAISTKAEAEQAKLEKVRELRCKKRPAAARSAPKRVAKQLEAGQEQEKDEQEQQQEQQEEEEEEDWEEEEEEEAEETEDAPANLEDVNEKPAAKEMRRPASNAHDQVDHQEPGADMSLQLWLASAVMEETAWIQWEERMDQARMVQERLDQENEIKLDQERMDVAYGDASAWAKLQGEVPQGLRNAGGIGQNKCPDTAIPQISRRSNS